MASLDKGARILYLRLLCLEPPQTDGETLFGLQDRQQVVYKGNLETDGALSYDLDVSVRYDPTKGIARFTGSFVHGTPSAPFLYLSLKRVLENGESGGWVRRLKVPLSGLTWSRIKAATDETLFVGRVAGSSSGMVPLLDGDWIALHNL